MKQLKKKMQKEDGSVLIMFAGFFTVLILFVALITDLALIYQRRNHMTEVAYMLKDARLDLGEELWHSYDPEGTMLEISRKIASKNNLDPALVDFVWTEPRLPFRSGYSWRRDTTNKLIIEDRYKTTTLKLIGIHELRLKVEVDGLMSTGASGYYMFHPRM